MKITARWTGLSEFRDDFKGLPDTLLAAAYPITRAAADGTAGATAAQMPRRSGELLAGLSVLPRRTSAKRVAFTVRSAAKYAAAYESGSRPRNYRGWNRGVMPAAHQMIPAAIRARSSMENALIAMVRAESFKVNG